MTDVRLTLIALTALAVVALLVAERKRSLRGVWVTKPIASLGFVVLACATGEMNSFYSQLVVLGLFACALGDVLLITPGAGQAFMGGMASFAVGHVAYLSAFLQFRPERTAMWSALAVMVVVGLATLRWLGPRLPKDMRIPIRFYIAIISAMVAVAVGASVEIERPWLAVGAIAFAISDLSVARDRFVQPAFVNVLWGLPLYYAAQVVFALTV